MEMYDIYHGKIEEMSVTMKPEPHVHIPISPHSERKVPIPRSFFSKQNNCIVVKWTFTSAERGSSYIEKPANGVTVLDASVFYCEGMVISSIIAVLEPGQKMHAATQRSEFTRFAFLFGPTTYKMKWTLEYNGKSPVVKNGKWKKIRNF